MRWIIPYDTCRCAHQKNFQWSTDGAMIRLFEAISIREPLKIELIKKSDSPKQIPSEHSVLVRIVINDSSMNFVKQWFWHAKTTSKISSAVCWIGSPKVLKNQVCIQRSASNYFQPFWVAILLFGGQAPFPLIKAERLEKYHHLHPR